MLWGRIKDKFKLWHNIRQVCGQKGYDAIWFYRTDFFFWLYMAVIGYHGKSKLVGLIYHRFSEKSILGRIESSGLKKMDLVIYTQENMVINHPRAFYMPDYLYRDEYYRKYREMPKERKVVCLGTISQYKDIEGLVRVFRNADIQLEIYGFFYDKEQYRRVKELATDNMIIEDCYLSKDGYYTKLGSARYCVLPYDMKQYGGRTSGVLQECIFLDVIPIAPGELLEANHIAGFNLNISKKSFQYETDEEMKIIEKNRSYCTQKYSWDSVQKKITSLLGQL